MLALSTLELPSGSDNFSVLLAGGKKLPLLGSLDLSRNVIFIANNKGFIDFEEGSKCIDLFKKFKDTRILIKDTEMVSAPKRGSEESKLSDLVFDYRCHADLKILEKISNKTKDRSCRVHDKESDKYRKCLEDICFKSEYAKILCSSKEERIKKHPTCKKYINNWRPDLNQTLSFNENEQYYLYTCIKKVILCTKRLRHKV